MKNFYASARWNHIRAIVLRRDNYQCQLSKRYGKIIQADMVHHIFPREQFPEYQWELWNLISLSNEMHNKLHDRITNNLTHEGMKLLKRTAEKMGMTADQTKKTRTLVIGLSGSGKTTYVKNHLGNGIAYDLDAIASAFRLGDKERHEQSRRMANDLLMGFVENANDYSDDVFIIRTAPTITELEAIDPTKLVVCSHVYVTRPYSNNAPQRISEAVDWCESKKIPITSPPV